MGVTDANPKGLLVTRLIEDINGAVIGFDEFFPVENLPEEDQVRVGFQKKTLKRAVFELETGGKVTYAANR